ncbi:hypothetical protein NL676_011223 [Syzygium grande]|nr:hypothetical protein NL676_011223 [Syzygium grande]
MEWKAAAAIRHLICPLLGRDLPLMKQLLLLNTTDDAATSLTLLFMVLVPENPNDLITKAKLVAATFSEKPEELGCNTMEEYWRCEEEEALAITTAMEWKVVTAIRHLICPLLGRDLPLMKQLLLPNIADDAATLLTLLFMVLVSE